MSISCVNHCEPEKSMSILGAVQGCKQAPPFLFPKSVPCNELGNTSPGKTSRSEQATDDEVAMGSVSHSNVEFFRCLSVAPAICQAHGPAIHDIMYISPAAVAEPQAINVKGEPPSTGGSEPSTMLPMKR
jgi:hypothetical protein